MKNKFSFLLLATLMLVFFFFLKEENKIFFEGGTAPVLTASTAGPLVLLSGNASQQALRFSWTNPDYSFNTGVSSHDVNYILQVDKAGSNFSSADDEAGNRWSSPARCAARCPACRRRPRSGCSPTGPPT